MEFRLRRDAKNWFEKLRSGDSPFTIDFDSYYCCAMAGLATGRASTPPEGWSNTNGLVDYFPGDYRGSRSLLISLLICTELKRLGIDLEEREEVQRKIDEFINPDSPSKLSDLGVTRLNEYASGGYELLVEQLGPKPEYSEDFLLSWLDELHTPITQRNAIQH